MFSELWVIYYKSSEASGILGVSIIILFKFSIYLFFKEPDPLAIQSDRYRLHFYTQHGSNLVKGTQETLGWIFTWVNQNVTFK